MMVVNKKVNMKILRIFFDNTIFFDIYYLYIIDGQ